MYKKEANVFHIPYGCAIFGTLMIIFGVAASMKFYIFFGIVLIAFSMISFMITWK